MPDTIVFSGVVVDLNAVEEAVLAQPEVDAAIAVGISDVFAGDGLNLFVVLVDYVEESYDLRKKLLNAVADSTGYPKPRGLRFVDTLPKVNGIPSRTATSQAAGGNAITDLDQLDDPTAIDAIRAAR